MLCPKAIYIITLLLFLSFLTENAVSQQGQDFSPATRERTRRDPTPQGLLANPDDQVERKNPPSTSPPTAPGPYPIPRDEPKAFAPVRLIQSIIRQAAAVLERVRSTISNHNKANKTPDNPYAVAILDSLTLASTSIRSGAQFLKSEYLDVFVGYCSRTIRYLNAAREHELSILLRQTDTGRPDDDSDQQQQQQPTRRGVSVRPSRQDTIGMIAERADLRLEEVTHLALVLERGVRTAERWSYSGGSLVMKIHGLWQFLTGQWPWQYLSEWWQSLQRSVAKYSVLAVSCLMGAVLLKRTSAILLAGLLFIICVMYLKGYL